MTYGKHAMYLRNNHIFTKSGKILHTKELTGMGLTKTSFLLLSNSLTCLETALVTYYE